MGNHFYTIHYKYALNECNLSFLFLLVSEYTGKLVYSYMDIQIYIQIFYYLLHTGFYDPYSPRSGKYRNKAPAQAAGAEPYRRNSTNRQNPPLSKMAVTFEPLMGI